jgi:hypothetical protein
VVVRPANEPDCEAVELLAEVLEQSPGLLQLDIDLGGDCCGLCQATSASMDR